MMYYIEDTDMGERKSMQQITKWSIILGMLFVMESLFAAPSCRLPAHLKDLAAPLPASQWNQYPDLRRNQRSLRGLCVYRVHFDEGKYPWQMLLLFNPRHPRGPFWFLPHDDENDAFNSGVYAIRKYGGGMLSVVSGGHRFFKGQDPNRNFGTDTQSARQCRGQKAPAPLYTRSVFGIIDSFRSGAPYLALHNNANGYSGNGGSGTISILRSTKRSRAFPAYQKIQRGKGGLMDEDTMVYIAGTSPTPPRSKISRLNRAGINVKYEWVDRSHNDCSMSNYVVLKKRTMDYYNIETQKGDGKTQREVIDRLMKLH